MDQFKQYRSFYTSSGKLAVMGKNALQNDALLTQLKESTEDYWVMHTSHPGSPFCAIMSELKKVTKKDFDECAIVTGCFSRAWKEGKEKTTVDLFTLGSMSKPSSVKAGTWQIKGKTRQYEVKLTLALTKQEHVYKALAIGAVKKPLAVICPGKIEKRAFVLKLAQSLGDELNWAQIDAALPAGGFTQCL